MNSNYLFQIMYSQYSPKGAGAKERQKASDRDDQPFANPARHSPRSRAIDEAMPKSSSLAPRPGIHADQLLSDAERAARSQRDLGHPHASGFGLSEVTGTGTPRTPFHRGVQDQITQMKAAARQSSPAIGALTTPASAVQTSSINKATGRPGAAAVGNTSLGAVAPRGSEAPGSPSLLKNLKNADDIS